MAKKATKENITKAAWKLFEQRGFDNVSVDDIVAEAGSSKGSFYHYFPSKEALLVVEPKQILRINYEQWLAECSPDMHAADKLIYVGRQICRTLELNVSLQMLTLVYSSQLTTNETSYMLTDSHSRWQLFSKIIQEGQTKGELSDTVACSELAQMVDMLLRGVTYNWCLLRSSYSLEAVGTKLLSIFLDSLRLDPKK